ncbi:MAG TPA: SH3 domain-containing protein, partial [Burkholderiales bacterium]|nr:SH3 domain-containing protein [Burkholderiales bacterium]
MRWLALLAFGLWVEHSVAGIAVVTHDRVPLRSAASPSAHVQATLLQGEAVEVRGERLDYLQVWDYQRERGGFVRASQVLRLDARAPHEILAALRLAQALPASEVLGIALASAYLQGPAEGDMDSALEALDAIGSLAERLARRNAPGTLEAAARYGVRFASLERDGRVLACYDGEAFRRVLALPSTPPQRARAALGLTRRECTDGTLAPTARAALD